MINRYRHPYRFLFLSAFIPWSLWFLAAYLSHRPDAVEYGLSITLLGLAGLSAPLVVAVYYIRKDRVLLNDVAGRLISVPTGGKRYFLASMLLMPASILLAMAISLLFGYDAGQFVITGQATFSSALFPVWFLLVIAPVLEELAWHSYGTDCLRQRFSLFTTSMIFAVYWAIWHFPLAFIQGYYHSDLVNEGTLHGVNFLISLFPFVLLMNWLYYKTGRNILVAVLLHLGANVFNEIFATHPDSKVIQTGLLLILTGYLLFTQRDFFFNKDHRFRSLGTDRPQPRLSETFWSHKGYVKHFILVCALAGAGLLGPVKAQADDGSYFATLGAGVMVFPDYEGSDDYEAEALPWLSLGWQSGFAAPEGGTGLQLGLYDVTLQAPGSLEAGIARLYRPEGVYRAHIGMRYGGGRDQDDNPALRGMGDIDGHAIATLGIIFEPRDSGWRYRLTAAQALGSDNRGFTAEGMIGYTLALGEQVTLTPSLQSTWADGHHMQTYFGVSPAQAATSAHARFDAGSGIKSVGFGAELGWAVSERWMLMGNFGVSQLLGDAADSPLVGNAGSATNTHAIAALTYTF